MIQPPILVGLKVCHKAIVEGSTKHVTLVNCFERLEVPSFPSPKVAFKTCVVLTDGLGDTGLSISVQRCSSLDNIYVKDWRVNFSDPLRQRWFLVPVSGCSFSEPGFYQVSLQAEKELLGQCVFEVYAKGGKK